MFDILEITFARPHYLSALFLVIPATAALLYLSFRLRARARQAYGETRLVDRFTRPLTLRGELGLMGAWLLAMTMLVVSMAGPLTKALPTTVPAGSLQVVAVVDVSKSMAAEDYRALMPPKDGYEPEMVPGPYGNRLDYVKHLLSSQVMPAIAGNQLGMVTYSGNGFEQVPLTDDWSSSRWVMDNWVVVGNAPGGGSDYAEGLVMALDMLERDQEADKQKVIVLFSDGGFTGTQEQLAEALKRAREMDVQLIIVGVGSRQARPIPVYSDKGQLSGFMEQDGATVYTAIEEGNLLSLRAQSGAEYILLDPDSSHRIDITWAATLGGTKAETRENPVFHYPLAAALMIVFGLFIRGVIRRRPAAV